MDIVDGELPGMQNLQDAPILASDEDPQQEHVVATPSKLNKFDSLSESLPTLRECVARALLVACKIDPKLAHVPKQFVLT